MKMRLLFLLVAALGLLTTMSLAQDTTKPAKPPKKAPKPKKHEPRVIILKVIDKTGATGEESLDRSLYGRAGVLTVFKQKKIEDISPAEVQGTIDQLQVDYTSPDNWTPDNLEKLAEPWEVNYVAAVTLDSLGEPSLTKARNPIISDTADFSVWLFDVGAHKFISEHMPFHYQYKNPLHHGESDMNNMAMDPKSVAYQVLSSGTKEAFLEALKTKPKR